VGGAAYVELGARGVEVPVVETERLRLRGYRPEDFADCAAMWADPEVTRYIGGSRSLKRTCGEGCCGA